jgi:quinol monooxygenase YgiN
MRAMQVDFHTTPLRANKFLELYRPAISRVLAYGAKGYLFYREEEDPDHFVHLSFWEDGGGFNRYWYSSEMQEIRQKVAGLYGQPVLPHWTLVVEQG